MTPKQSTTRLVLYVVLATLTALLPDLETIRHAITNGQVIVWIDWLIILIKSIISGGIVARAYIDQTPTKIEP